MSADPTDALFKAIRSKLIADSQIAAAVGSRVASDWAKPLDAPFIRLSVPRTRPYDDECGAGAETRLRVHVWAKNAVACGTLAGRVRDVLDAASLTIAGHDLDEITYEETTYSPDRDDPNLSMGIATFNVITTAI